MRCWLSTEMRYGGKASRDIYRNTRDRRLLASLHHFRATSLEYLDVSLEIIDETTVHLSAKWRMNVEQGVITLEKLVKQPNGQGLLGHDAFEVLEQFSPTH